MIDKDDLIERLTVTNENFKNSLDEENSRKLNLELQLLKNELEFAKKRQQQDKLMIEEESSQVKLYLQEEKQKNSNLLADMEKMEENMKKLITKNKTIDQDALKILADSHETLQTR